MTPERTALDLATHGPLVERVVALDAMLRAGIVDRAGLRVAFADRYRWRGIRGARLALDYADGLSESPMETRLRMLLVLAGLPRPQVQWEVRDRAGLLVARFDLAYPQHWLAIEYDGAHHRGVRAGDHRRDNSVVFVEGERWAVLRFNADDYYRWPDAIVAIVTQAIATSR